MEQIPSEFMARVRRLEALALPQTAQETREYEQSMNIAKANGSTRVNRKYEFIRLTREHSESWFQLIRLRILPDVPNACHPNCRQRYCFPTQGGLAVSMQLITSNEANRLGPQSNQSLGYQISH